MVIFELIVYSRSKIFTKCVLSNWPLRKGKLKKALSVSHWWISSELAITLKYFIMNSDTSCWETLFSPVYLCDRFVKSWIFLAKVFTELKYIVLWWLSDQQFTVVDNQIANMCKLARLCTSSIGLSLIMMPA